MNSRHLTISTALVFMFAGAVGQASAKTQHAHCNMSGTFTDGVETNIDTNGDGVSATLDQALENCNTGRFFFQQETEWILQKDVTTCPNVSGLEEHIDQTQGQHRGVSTNEKTGDQLFYKITSATLCVNTSDGTITSSGQFEYIGGTGKYTGATGTGNFQSAGSYLMFGFKGGAGGPFGGFGQYTGTNDSTLNLPKDNKD